MKRGSWEGEQKLFLKGASSQFKYNTYFEYVLASSEETPRLKNMERQKCKSTDILVH